MISSRSLVHLPARDIRTSESGHSRDCYVYVPCDGVLRTEARIGEEVRQGQEVAEIGHTVLTAPLDGTLRSLPRDGVPVTARAKMIEVDPCSAGAEIRGSGERPRRIAYGVLAAIHEWDVGRAGEALQENSTEE